MAIPLKQPCDEGIIRSRPFTAPCEKSAEPWILAATILGSGMAFIDGTVVNVAVSNAAARTAGLLAIAVFGILMLRTFNHTLDGHLQNLNVPPSTPTVLDEQRSRLAGVKHYLNFDPRTKMELTRVVDRSFILAFRVAMLLSGSLALASAVHS